MKTFQLILAQDAYRCLRDDEPEGCRVPVAAGGPWIFEDEPRVVIRQGDIEGHRGNPTGEGVAERYYHEKCYP